ncbi:site-specific DNA-methyltransferase [Pseudoxanthomonas mexicana]|uniref:site-specific DNA-methyltransferase n=1 Tax=Pseudoxanthomonas mexicana TaxID=128785 RepID=UPI00398A5A0E
MAKASAADIRAAILDTLPEDGSTIGNGRLRELIAAGLGVEVDEDAYFSVRDALVQAGQVGTGRGRGGSVRRVLEAGTPLTLEAQAVPEEAKAPKVRQAKAGKKATGRRGEDASASIIAYQHADKRRNNPDVGVVTPETDPDQPKTTWAYDPHIDPALQFDIGRAQIEKLIDDALASGDEAVMREALEQLRRQAEPYLNWTGKAERTSFDVDTVSLHVHERIDPASVLAVVRKRLRKEKGEHGGTGDMFRAWFEEPLPYREAIEFYKHDRGWANRLVTGDSLLVMNSLVQKEGMAGQVQMIYIDPPYGIKYGSNFQPFVNKRDVKDRKDEDLTQEPEMIKAFRDTWELGIHSYLTYLRDRLLLAKELLHESGSIFVQISDENLHRVRNLLDDVFGGQNFSSLIAYSTTGGFPSATLSRKGDYVLWYAKDISKVKYRRQYLEKTLDDAVHEDYDQVEQIDGSRRALVREEKMNPSLLAGQGRVFTDGDPTSQGEGAATVNFDYFGITLHPGKGNHWKAPVPHGMRRLARSRRFYVTPKSKIRYVRYFDDFPAKPITNTWFDIAGAVQDRADPKVYVVQTSNKIVERCLLLTTDPGDLVLDPTCGSGTTAFVAEKWGRRWITCDTSRVAITLAKQRLMTASYDYYELKYPHEGLRGGFIYRTVPHVTLKSIANNPDIDDIYERMHPAIDAALGRLNAALKSGGAPFKAAEGARKGTTLDFDKGDALHEWEVPFDFPADWKPAVRESFDAFHAARQTMQKKMDESIAAHADQETLYDQPAVSKDKLRITGPFTVEAVPFPSVLSLEESEQPQEADASVARLGESLRQHTWRDELLRTGIRGKGGQMIHFADLETLPDTRHLHCIGHTEAGERVVVSFGPEHGALEQKQVELAMRAAGDLFPRPKMIVFCAFTFDPEAAKDIDATKGITALKAQMNTDLLTEDLKKKARSNQSFWLMGQPDVELRQRKDGRYEVEVNGFDYFNTTTGKLESGGKKNIAAWSLDTDYDERSLFPRQVFFPMAGAKDGWNKLRRTIRAELDESRLDKLHGTVSLPFEPGDNRKVAVKIVDDRGIESLKVLAVP